MRRTAESARYAGLLLVVFLAVIPTAAAPKQQPGPRPQPRAEFLNVKVVQFRLRDQTILDALWQLARGPAPFGFGFERPLQQKSTSPPFPLRHFSLRLTRETVRQLLDALCRADPRFTWSVDGTMVNVYPRAIVGDPTYLLNRRLSALALRNVTRVEEGLFAIPQQLPPPFEQVAVAQVGGADPYPRKPWTVTFRNLTVRQAVNRLAQHGGRCAVWIFGGATDFRAFGFFNTNLC